MDFSTAGKYHYKDFHLPLRYCHYLNTPSKNDAVYQILYSPEADILTSTSGKTSIFTAPTALLISSENTLNDIKINQEGRVHHFIFKTSALNDPDEKDWDTEDIGKQFYLKPFRWDPETGFYPLSLHESQKYRLNQLCDSLNAVLNDQTEQSWPCLSRSYFLEILILIQRSLFRSPRDVDVSISEIPDDLQPILEYLFTHYHQNITVEDIARKFATNRTTLNRLIKDSTGYSPLQFLNKIRCDVARSLLRKTHLSIGEISARVGIEETSYFSRFFKKQIGCSPLEYRGRHPDPYS